MAEQLSSFSFRRGDFPPGFAFGAATSAYQIEGQRFGGAGRNHWDSFAATPGNVHLQQNGDVACDHYHRYAEDLDLAAGAGLDAYRFSVAWSRVIPEGLGATNEAGLDFYDRLVDAACARGLKPFATLYHWELPAPLADRGGWRNADIAAWFADFAETVLRRIGDRLHAVAPVNEPWCVAWLGHYLGVHAPGVRDIRAAARAMHHVLLAHGLALEVIRALGAGLPGAVFNFEHATPADDSDESARAARFYDGGYNRWFLEAVCKGRYPDDVLALVEPHLPAGWDLDMARISAPVDWIGANYYTRKLIAAVPGLPLPAVAERAGDLPRTTMGWEVYPSGLGEFLRRVHACCDREIPIFVTENGMSAADQIQDREIEDQARIAYIEAHLEEVRSAIEDGVPVAGYFIWSLLDNYEWTLGYDKRFGLVHVDFDTLQRTPKRSWHALREALSS